VPQLPQGASGGAASPLQGLAGLGGEAKAGPDTDWEPGPSKEEPGKASPVDEKMEGLTPNAIGAGNDEGGDTPQPPMQVSRRSWGQGSIPSRSLVSRDRNEGSKEL
jgi:hypothetical protein